MVWLTTSVLAVMMAAPMPAAGDCVLEGVLSLETSAERTSVTDTVVYLKDGPPRARPRPKTHEMAQRQLQFWPRTMVVMINDRVSFVNQDAAAEHSVFSTFGNDPFEGEVNKLATTYTRTFATEGPVHIQCNVHKGMWADILVLSSPAFARPDAKGRWRITGLERKNYTLVAWEPNGGEETREVVCGGGKVKIALEGRDAPEARRRDGSVYPPYEDAVW